MSNHCSISLKKHTRLVPSENLRLLRLWFLPRAGKLGLRIAGSEIQAVTGSDWLFPNKKHEDTNNFGAQNFPQFLAAKHVSCVIAQAMPLCYDTALGARLGRKPRKIQRKPTGGKKRKRKNGWENSVASSVERAPCALRQVLWE